MSLPKIRHSRADVRARAEREHAELDALVRILLPEDWLRPVPRAARARPWRVKDSVAHIVFWKSHTARVMRGERPPEPLRGLPYSRLNEIVYEDWKDASVEQLLAWHERVQRQVLEAIDGRDAEWFGRQERSPFWPSDLESHSAGHRRDDIEAVISLPAREEVAAG